MTSEELRRNRTPQDDHPGAVVWVYEPKENSEELRWRALQFPWNWATIESWLAQGAIEEFCIVHG